MLAFLLESAVRSLALGIVVWIALRLLRVRTPQTRSLAWTAVLLASVTMPLFMKVMASAPPATVAWIPAAQTRSFPLVSVASNPTLPVSPAPAIDWITIASAIYLSIACVFVLRLLAGLLRGHRLVSQATPLTESWSSGLNVRASANLTIPATYGSTILFPADWPQWSVFKRDAVLLHELTHVRRRDFHIHLLADIFRSVFWFNPMAWWLRRELLELAEAACDDEAIRKVGDRVSYAEVLIEFASKGSIAGFAGVPMASGRTVAGRVERMLRGDSVAPQTTSLLRRAALIAAFVPLVAVAAGFWQVRAAQRPPQAEPTNFLTRWPEEEVPYLIAAEERDAFQRLRTDQEREQFINAFWLRRDPTPFTPNNEYRDEYYRRIAVVNQRFSAGIPGWRTDRGRIWIMYGPPEEIETHAQGGTGQQGRTNTFPFEQWRYRSIEGLGNNITLEFVDSTRDGNYRLEYDPADKQFIDRFVAPKP